MKFEVKICCCCYFKYVLAPSSDGLKVDHHDLDWSLWHYSALMVTEFDV